jgi:hypothetical protein
MFLLYASFVMAFLENQYRTYHPFKNSDYFRHFQAKYRKIQMSKKGQKNVRQGYFLDSMHSLQQVVRRVRLEREMSDITEDVSVKILPSSSSETGGVSLPAPAPLPQVNGRSITELGTRVVLNLDDLLDGIEMAPVKTETTVEEEHSTKAIQRYPLPFQMDRRKNAQTQQYYREPERGCLSLSLSPNRHRHRHPHPHRHPHRHPSPSPY